MVDFPLLFWTGLGRCQSASASNRGWKCFGGKALEEARDSGQPTVQQFARPVQLQCQSTADPPQNKPGLLEEGWNTQRHRQHLDQRQRLSWQWMDRRPASGNDEGGRAELEEEDGEGYE